MHIHILGICGTFMGGLAVLAKEAGHRVTGCDANVYPPMSTQLEAQGIELIQGYGPEQVSLEPDLYVVGNVMTRGNPLIEEILNRGLPYMSGPQWIGEHILRHKWVLAVAGTHGKTTTTSLTAAVLSEGGLDPTFVIGGQLLAAGANAKLGSGQWLVAEADESDGSFLRLNPLVSVITNIDADHLENYGNDFARVQAAFAEFLQRLPFYGLAVLCIDDPEVAALAAQTPRHVMSYGMSSNADVRAEDVVQDGPRMRFTLRLPEGSSYPVTLALPGAHNVLNALAAAAVGWQLGVAPDAIARALESFAGIGRRFNDLGIVTTHSGARVRLIDDYGHHPRELAAVFAAARGGWPDQRLVVAFQPHRYSRTRDQFDAFAAVLSEVDALVLSEVYPAGEAPIPGADSRSLARAIRARGRSEPVVVGHTAELSHVLPDVLQDGDLLLMMGAGDIGHVAQLIATEGFTETPAA